jgi:hypothetical protein
MLSPDGAVAIDAGVGDEPTEVDASAEGSSDHAVNFDAKPDLGSADRSTPDAGLDAPLRDSGPCDGGLLCGKTCVDPLTDNDNCGRCNFKCNVYTSGTFTMGGCEKGLCAPSYGACFTGTKPYFTCDEMCAQEGATCVQAGCLGATHIEYTYPSDCDDKQVSMISANQACNQPAQFASGQRAGRCCCARRPGD